MLASGQKIKHHRIILIQRDRRADSLVTVALLREETGCLYQNEKGQLILFQAAVLI